MDSSQRKWQTRESSGKDVTFLSKAFLHKKDLPTFLQAVKRNPQEFQDWIEKIRNDFPRDEEEGGEGVEKCAEGQNSENEMSGDFHKPLNEIKASRVCTTLVRKSVCEIKRCWRRMVCL
eukprot:Skav208368  [mRNA]  locus=scaffold1964:603385:603741:- [translate_table: standard]